MNWTDLLKSRIEETYHATEGLVGLVDDKSLSWKPVTGANWMTTGQLLKHLETACGACCKGFVTGDWSIAGEDMLPTADKLPATKSVADTKKALAADKRTALQMVVESGEKNLGGKKVAAPWDPTERLLGEQFLNMIGHLSTHKAQLFYYLKLQGKPVNTAHMYGM
ncbi:MAG TPA: DinB family protein [Planctomycetota bacterium]|nr:DinB family protein [Planctomycetota bacterium]